ncbi:hypothetical protein [Methanobacterium sp. ACI-7]|uniref:hypothetical protein n=1 Tax=unclassified Methanobacterium TaxID=2627676 RepID=UPI0039C28457
MISKKSEVSKTVSKTESIFYSELKDFKEKDVTIILVNGHSIRGKVLAIEFNDLNFIIEHGDGVKEMINGGSIQSVRIGTKIEKE